MPTDAPAELRALALWHTRRRAVDELLGPLLEYGPVAVERVIDRLDQVCDLVENERRAFDAFVAVVNAHRQEDAVVLEMFGRRGPETPEVADS
jgi:hypothetical protein